MPADQNAGQREGVYFAGGFSGELSGRVTGLRATDTQSRRTQTFGIRVENQARIVANDDSVAGNLAGDTRHSEEDFDPIERIDTIGPTLLAD